MTHQEEIVGLLLRLVSVLNESGMNSASALAAVKVAKILYVNRDNADSQKVLQEKFGLSATA